MRRTGGNDPAHADRQDGPKGLCARSHLRSADRGTVASSSRGLTMRADLLTRLVPLVILASIARSAAADPLWTPVAQTDDSVYLLDESSIEVRAGLLTAWELVEYTLPQYADGVGYRSQLNLRAYRCGDRS